MSFGREKRLLLGWLAALAPLPLPFNEMLEWSFVAAYLLAVGVFLYRAAEGAEDWLPAWALNLIGLVYLPVVYLDFTRFWSGQILRPLLHLAGFALVVKLFAVKRERDKWHILIGIFFLFLASMGTSVNPAVLIYLLVFLALTILTLVRFAALHFLTTFRQPASTLSGAPWWRFLGATALATVLVAAALFPILPRIGSPYIVAGAAGAGRRVQSSGFSNVMSLDGIGRIRTSSEVALRLRYESLPPARHELRYKGATYDLFQGTSWRQSPLQSQRLERGGFDYFHLQEHAPSSWVSVWQEPMGVRNLFIPVEAVAVDIRARQLAVDEGGAVFARGRPPGAQEYRVALGVEAQSIALPPQEDGLPLDQTGVSDAIRELAGTVMGVGPVSDRVKRLQDHLAEEYEYTLDLLGRSGDNPIESFLFEDRRGHCEYFASAMVLMLRSQGVPARLVTGFLGGERSPLDDYLIVRQSNAHAWVEAYLPNEGWRVYEPTPPSGRPTAGSSTLWRVGMQAYDYLVFRWDRYILTFGASDQVSLFSNLREAWAGMRKFLFGDSAQPDGTEPIKASDLDLEPAKTPSGRQLEMPRHLWLLAIVLGLAAAGWGWLRRPPFDATLAYRRLRRRAQRRGLDLPASLPPIAMAERVKEIWPDAAEAVDPIVRRYLEESFGGRALGADESVELRDKLRQAGAAMRKAA